MAKQKADLKELESRCKLLEGRCDEYVQALRMANRATGGSNHQMQYR